MYKVSVVIPVYNGSKYIDRMMKSLLGQTFKDFEIIVVDDGSTDDTFSKISKYECENIVVYTKKNTGVSDTRNIGFEKSKGDYIIFLDADDEVDQDFLETMYKEISGTNSDIVLCEYKEVYGNKEFYKEDLKDYPSIIGNQKKKELISRTVGVKDGRIANVQRALVWRTMIRRDVIEKNRIKFDVNVAVAEDMLFLLRVYAASKKIAIIHKPLYIYYRYIGSVLNKYINNNYEGQIYFHAVLIDTLKELCIFDELIENYVYNRYDMYISGFCNAVRNPCGLKQKYLEYKLFYKDFYKDEFMKQVKISGLRGYRKYIMLMLKCRMKRLVFIAFRFKEFLKMKKLKEEGKNIKV